MTTRPRRSTLLLCLLVALALHLLGAILLLVLLPEGEPAEASAGLYELDLVLPPPPEAAAPQQARARSSSQQEPTRPRPPRRKPERPAPFGPPAPPAGPPVPPMDLSMRGLDLSPSPDLFAPEQPRDPGGRTLHDEPTADRRSEAARVKARLDGWIKRDTGRRNAYHGRVHPALVALLRRAQDLFSPTEATVPKRLRHNGKELLQAYRAGIETYNKMGRALPLDYQDYGQVITPPLMLEGNAAIAKGVKQRGGQHRFTEICIHAAPSRRPEVSEQRSSGIKALDREARQAMEGALALAMPDDLPRTTACYRFGLAWGQTMPAASLAYLCSLVRSGGRTLRHGVRLVAAWPEERRTR